MSDLKAVCIGIGIALLGVAGFMAGIHLMMLFMEHVRP